MKTNEEPIYGIKAVKCLLDIGVDSDTAIRLAYPYITAEEKELLTAKEWIGLFRAISKDRKNSYRDEVFEWARKRSTGDFSNSISLAGAMMSAPGEYKKEWWSFLLQRVESVKEANYLYYQSDMQFFCSKRKRHEAWMHWLNLVILHNNQEIALKHFHEMWCNNESRPEGRKFSQRQAEILWRAILGKSKKWGDLKWLYKKTEKSSEKAIVYRKMKKFGRNFERRRWLFENKAKYSYTLILETIRFGLKNYRNWDDVVWLFNLAKDNYHKNPKLFARVDKILVDKAINWEKKLFTYEHREPFYDRPGYYDLLLSQANTYERAAALWKKTPRDSEEESKVEWHTVELIENIEQACQMIIIIKQKEHYREKPSISSVQIKDLVPKIKKFFAKSKKAIEYFLNTIKKHHSDLLKQGSDFLPVIEETLVSFEDWKWYFEKDINPNLVYEKMFSLVEKDIAARSSQDTESLLTKRYQYLYGALSRCYFPFKQMEEYQQMICAKIVSFQWYLERMGAGGTDKQRFDFFKLARMSSDNGYNEIRKLLSIAEEYVHVHSGKDGDKEIAEKFKKEHAEILKLAIGILSVEQLSEMSFDRSWIDNHHIIVSAMKEKALEPSHWVLIYRKARYFDFLLLKQEAEDQLLRFVKSEIKQENDVGADVGA